MKGWVVCSRSPSIHYKGLQDNVDKRPELALCNKSGFFSTVWSQGRQAQQEMPRNNKFAQGLKSGDKFEVKMSNS